MESVGFIAVLVRYAKAQDKLESRMRAVLIAMLVLGLTACSEDANHIDYGEMDMEKVLAEAPAGPLPAAPYPTHYALDLTLDPRDARFGGTVTLTLALEDAAHGVYLHGRDLNITQVRSRIGGANPQNGTWSMARESGVAWLGFGQRAAPGEITVEIEYDAPFDANLSGLFKVTEQGDAYALAKSESIQARRFMPGFDQPAFKAPFDITLTIPETDSAISNAPEASV